MIVLLACTAAPIPIGPTSERDPVELPTGDADWYVDASGGGDFSTIQAAVDAAAPGDWILVEPGTYSETVDFEGKTLWITSRDGASATTIDGGRNTAAILAQGGESDGTGLVGFTITGGNEAAVYVDFSAMHLEQDVISGVTASYVIEGSAADLELTDVTISGNREFQATVVMSRGSLQMNGGSLSCGRSSYGIYHGHGYMQLDGTTLSCSSGYAIYSEHTTGTVFRSLVTGTLHAENEDDHTDDTIALRNTVLNGNYEAIYGTMVMQNSLVRGSVSFTKFPDAPGTPVLENNIFTGPRCSVTSDGDMVVRNNDFWKSTPSCDGTVWEDGNRTDDPAFVDFSGGDYHLSKGSPLIDAGVDEAGYEDIDGSRNDIGVYGGHYSLDGGW